ncbi:carbon-nitrogen hydrolase family protein [Heyndrickxia acidicola]|uniref:Carbon-nitrogen hydrolase family protein n=1 Tax=Heyndrickxia acidicola TaxID=209389 RepID=A0ABU6MN36_9BACI|nr:carbon-nitrogen hydrolase family protein [Heyndrickxia acidicola]MED1205724.1 carbon-nitrogen hydrolase family protein [Heyndrickxia acidicola]
MKIALAQTRFPASALEGLNTIKKMILEAGEKNCQLICFPESLLPGLRGVGYEIEDYNHDLQMEAVEQVRKLAVETGVSVILPMEWKGETGMHIIAKVISNDGEILGFQTKNQMDPEEDQFNYVPGEGRKLFKVGHLTFGIVICHEGWRYPETVRWAARKGARIVFHPQYTGIVENPGFYNYAMVSRSLENNIYFASVNYALKGQETTSAIISPKGEILAAALPEKEELLVYEIEPELATGLLASRFLPSLC